ncbi:MAG: IclR family transcriptional regulator [Sulfuritalea sp.]|nr:IclR family transcriptional regulator [Sulfuritalea sp.]
MRASRSETDKAFGANASGVDVLDRAFAILFAFRPDDPPLSLAELAARTGLYKSTLLRLANALIHHRFLDKLDDGRYRLGSAPFALGSIYQSSLSLGDVLLPLMREFNQELGEAMSFHVREGDHRVCLYRINSRFAIRPEVRQGAVQALERGAGGRVLLAFSGKSGAPYDEIRRTFSYISCGERDPETSGISVPVFGVQQCLLGALGIVGPSNRLGRAELERLRPRLLHIAARATDLLGGNPEHLLAASHSTATKSASTKTTSPRAPKRKATL